MIDAEGQVVAPGFVDGHTHMDAQVFWDPLGTSSCYHGITSVVMGNCGFTLAPCAEADKHLVVRNLQRAEDIPPQAMEAGIKWSWTTFPEFLDTLDALPKGINYARLHRPLRAPHVRDGRARVRRQATEDDLRAMERELRDAIRAGAIGFTTSRSPAHETPDARPVASRLATWDEVRRLVGVMGEMNAGIFELAGEGVDREPAIRACASTTCGCAISRSSPGGRSRSACSAGAACPTSGSEYLDSARRDRGRGRAHVRAGAQPLALSALLSFKTQMPFDRLPVWKEIRALPLAEQSGSCAIPSCAGS